MTTLAFPTLSHTRATTLNDWSLVANTFVHQSPFTRGTQTASIPGALWSFSESWMNMRWADRAIFEGWLAKLGGQNGRFYKSHPMWSVPRGTARGTGTTGAAAQFATSIVLTGAGIPNGSTLLAGDFVEIDTALLIRVTDNATAAGGTITINFAPMLRIAVSSSTAFTLVSPKGQFRLIEDKQGISVRPGPQGFGDLELNAVEAF